MREALNLIDGRWQGAACNRWGARHGPATGIVVGRHTAPERDVRAAFASQGVHIVGGSADDLRKFNAAQDQKWSTVIRRAGIKAD